MLPLRGGKNGPSGFTVSGVGFNLLANSGSLASAVMYFSSPRSHSTANIHCFHGIQLEAFSISIWYPPDVYSSDIFDQDLNLEGN